MNNRPNAKALLDWYDQHRRIMPWRALSGKKPNPYYVWLSEIMLQQTTVATVGSYFEKFIRRWPTLQHLAKASIDDVLRMWAGLGYYRRARGLHACAHLIVKDHKGIFPHTEKELLELPGFGSYTAAAVTAIAFNQRANVVDGNVERVMARLFAVRAPLAKAKKILRAKAATLLPKQRYGDYAQALMDLGATICTPRKPKCNQCPWAKSCRAYKLGLTENLPLKVKKKKKPIRYTIAFVALNKKGEILIRQRPPTGLLGGMMEIPSSAWREGAAPTLTTILPEAPLKLRWQLLPKTIIHIFSHFELHIQVAFGTSSQRVEGLWVAPNNLEDEALPSVMRKIARYALSLV